MPLAAGTRLGPYEIVSALGAGGMGEVYRARDARLGRDVAIKVLPASLTSSPEVRARFEREAKTVSSLNHPNICTLFDVGREGETDFLVMELIEGETLAQRIERGALPTADVIRIGTQVADALDRAHRAGVVHRDLKPGNIMLTKSGAKLMDFGLARATGLTGPGSGSGVTVAGLSQSPTMASPLTAEGTIIGTFQYMAPEQLEGREADARADLWALGCVLYEMAAGKRAFDGKSQASLIGSIMNSEPPPVSGLAPMSPPAFDQLVRACLAKDPDERIQTAHDVKLQLQWIASGGSQAGVPAPVAARRRTRERLAWIVAVVAGLAALALGAFILLTPKPETLALRFSILPEGTRNLRWPRISPDARLLAYQADDTAGVSHIWIRPMNAFVATPLAGTENAGRPFWSPDGKSLAFSVGSQMKRIAVSGGPAQLVGDIHGGYDGSWGDGVILFDGSLADSIRQIPADGGEVTPAMRLDRSRGELYHAWPLFLPDGKQFLFLASGSAGSSTEYLRLGRLGSLDSRLIGPVPSRVEYSPSGHVLYVQDGTLMARPIDIARARFTGGAFPVAENVVSRGDEANMSVSLNSTLAALTGTTGGQSVLQWLDRTGKLIEQVGPPDAYRDPALSRDGTRLAYGLSDPTNGNQDLWVRDLRRGIATRVTFDSKSEVWPVWSPDGSRLAYASNESGTYIVLARGSDGTGAVDTLYRVPGPSGPTSWTADGKTLLMITVANTIQMMSVAPIPGSKGTPVQKTQFTEVTPQVSPDGRWLAYATDETGRREVFVQAYPGPGGKWRVSSAGGGQPAWRADGRELFYRASDGTLMAVPIRVEGAGLDAGTPVALFNRPTVNYSPFRNSYDVSPDGQRFLVNVLIESGDRAGRVHVMIGWATEAKKK
jgi:Tol biopolymer transport system component